MGREKNAKAEPEGQQYLYKDEELRLKRSNRLVFLSTVIMFVIVIAYLVMRMMFRETNRPMLPQIANWITILALITNIVMYKVKKLKYRFRITNAVSVGVVYVAVMFMTDATFVYWLLAAILLMNLPFYDWKYSKKLAIFYWVSYVVSVLYRQMSGNAKHSADGYALVATIIATIFLATMVAKVMNIYMKDITGYMG